MCEARLPPRVRSHALRRCRALSVRRIIKWHDRRRTGTCLDRAKNKKYSRDFRSLEETISTDILIRIDEVEFLVFGT